MPLKTTVRKKVDDKIDEIIDKQIDKMVDKTLKELDEKEVNENKENLNQDNQNEKRILKRTRLFLLFPILLFFLPYICANDSPEKNFYANQGLVLLLTSLVFGVVIGLLSLISSVLGWVLSAIVYILLLAELVYGVVKTLQGNEKTQLPIIGQITIIK